MNNKEEKDERKVIIDDPNLVAQTVHSDGSRVYGVRETAGKEEQGVAEGDIIERLPLEADEEEGKKTGRFRRPIERELEQKFFDQGENSLFEAIGERITEIEKNIGEGFLFRQKEEILHRYASALTQGFIPLQIHSQIQNHFLSCLEKIVASSSFKKLGVQHRLLQASFQILPELYLQNVSLNEIDGLVNPALDKLDSLGKYENLEKERETIKTLVDHFRLETIYGFLRERKEKQENLLQRNKAYSHHSPSFALALTATAVAILAISSPTQTNYIKLKTSAQSEKIQKITPPEKIKPDYLITNLQHQVSELERQLGSGEARYLIQDQNFAAQKKELSYWQARTNETESRFPWLVLSHQQKVREYETAIREADNAHNSERERLEKEINKLEKDNQKMEAEYRAEISKLGKENVDLEGRYAPKEDQLKNLISDYQKINTELRKQLKGLVGIEEKRNYQIKIAGLEGKIRELNDKYRQEKVQTTSLNQIINDLKKEFLLYIQKETLRLSRKARQERIWLDFGTPEKLCYHLTNQTCNSNMLAFTRTNYTKIKEYVMQHSRR